MCVSVTGQAETLIPLDGDGEALGEAIVWLDTRAQEECERFSREIPGGPSCTAIPETPALTR